MKTTIDLLGTPFSLPAYAHGAIVSRILELEDWSAGLRQRGILSPETLKSYYEEKRFLHVAASNALEGNPLSVEETKLVILNGEVVTGHDPAFVRDAVALDNALRRITELARDQEASTDLSHVKELHGMILGQREGAGLFRSQPVRISGSSHRPPESWRGVMGAMEDWERWSQGNREAPAVVRSVVLHAWLTHIHPFVDGNGRTARAIGNLELLRQGFPPVIIKKKDRHRYLDALSLADMGGDLQYFFDFLLERMADALVGLEHSARVGQGYDLVLARLREEQERRLAIWLMRATLLLDENLRERGENLGE